jgi:hypothetical protein
MLAFMASVIALNMSRVNEEKQRSRNFIAARALLPEALSELNSYLENCVPLIHEFLAMVNKNDVVEAKRLKCNLPSLPSSCKDVFKSCISHAEDDVGNYLALILNHLQVNQARLEHSVSNSHNGESSTILVKINILDHIYDLARLKVLIDNLYTFARGEEVFKENKVSLAMINQAYRQLRFFVEIISGLDENTKSRF